MRTFCFCSFEIFAARTCGGVSMSGCSLFVNGEFVTTANSSGTKKPVRFYVTRNNQSISSSSGSNATRSAVVAISRPLCAREEDVLAGDFLWSTKTFIDYNTWAPFNCSLVPLDLETVTKVSFGGKGPVIFLGDSHSRNLFSAFVAGVRQQEYFLETHDNLFKEQQGIAIYRIHKVRGGGIVDFRGETWAANRTTASLLTELSCDKSAEWCIQVSHIAGVAVCCMACVRVCVCFQVCAYIAGVAVVCCMVCVCFLVAPFLLSLSFLFLFQFSLSRCCFFGPLTSASRSPWFP